LDALAQKTYGTGSGRDPPSIVWIPLTVRSKFGASLTFYVLSDAALCCFSEAILGKFSVFGNIKSSMILLLCPQFSLS